MSTKKEFIAKPQLSHTVPTNVFGVVFEKQRSYMIQINEEQRAIIVAHLAAAGVSLAHIDHQSEAWDTVEEERDVLLQMFDDLADYVDPYAAPGEDRGVVHGFCL